MPKRKVLLAILLVLVLSTSLTACSAAQNTAHLSMAPMDKMPAWVQGAAASVQQAYQFAVANPDVMKDIPCYCGCGRIGHTSNYSCYVQSVDPQGGIQFDNHALGCSLCVNITQDTMRLLQEGQTPQQIRAYVDANYSKYGPSNMAPVTK